MENNKVTVIIPARNEEETIEEVIKIAKNSYLTDEIIVVDNNSTDNTADISKKCGTTVIKCDNIGKGYAMTQGIKYASNDIIIFLDADVLNYKTNIIEILALPVINNEADFVKSTFDRATGGKVTKIAIKPLLKILYPDLYEFQEPISGMIACKKSILEKMNFEVDYGVDIGIVLDAYNMGLKITEVNIGQILNMSHNAKTMEIMEKMSFEVMRTIIKKSKEHGKI